MLQFLLHSILFCQNKFLLSARDRSQNPHYSIAFLSREKDDVMIYKLTQDECWQIIAILFSASTNLVQALLSALDCYHIFHVAMDSLFFLSLFHPSCN